MPLELATRLILRNADDGSPLSSPRLRELVATWAWVPDAAAGDVTDVAGRGGGIVSARQIELTDTARSRWDLQLRRPDDQDADIEWGVSVTGVFDPDRTTFVVRLRRDARDHRLRPLLGAPAPPAVIRGVLESEDVDCFDGPWRVQPRWTHVSRGDVGGFVTTVLLDEERRLPVLAVAKAGGEPAGRLDANWLSRELAGFAHVVLIDRNALLELHKQMENLSVGQNSARLWWPGLEFDDEANLHPHWTGPFADGKRAAEAIRRLVLGVSHDRWREPSRLLDFDRAVRDARDQAARAAAARVAAEVALLRRSAADARAQEERAGHMDAASVAERDAYAARLATMADDLDDLREQADRLKEAADDATELWTEAEAEKERLEKENRALRGQLSGARAQLRESVTGDTSVLTDEEELARDVRATWSGKLTADDQARRPLAEFRIRPGFADSIRAAGADRQKVVEIIMQIACGLAKDIDSRQLHRLRDGPSGGAPNRTRADGAQAWRGYLQVKTPSARRLHYWVLPGGELEFVSVVTHDQVTIAD